MLTLGPRPRHLPVLPVLLLTLAALALGSFYRIPDLDHRILHTDEAVHMVKLGQLMDDNSFIYDPNDFHGPTMYMATVAFARVAGWTDSSDITITGVRAVIVIFGLLVMVSPLFFVHAIGRGPAVLASLLLAGSPAFVYYSRYYIMEMLLVAFAAAALFCGWRWYLHRGWFWLVCMGVLLGLMHATKETFVFNVAGAIGAITFMWLFRPRGSGLRLGDYKRKNQPVPWTELTVVGLVFALTSALLMSNFFQHPKAIWDSYLTYLLYFERAGGSGHEKPWHYYLQTLGWSRANLIWTELFILALGLIGALSLWLRRDTIERPVMFGRFLALYTLFQFIAYSIIPYKTPWTILSAYYGCVLLAGVGVSSLFHLSSLKWWRFVVMGIFIAGLWHLCLQSRRVTGRFASDPRNPYVYSHTNPMLMRLVKQLNDLQAVMPEGEHLRVHIFETDQGWPLPWYLRDMPMVGYHKDWRTDLEAEVFVLDARWLATAREFLGDEYVQDGPHGLRPGLSLTAYVKRPLWEALLEARGVRPAASRPAAPPPDEEENTAQPPAMPSFWPPAILSSPPDEVQPPLRFQTPETPDPEEDPPLLRALPAD